MNKKIKILYDNDWSGIVDLSTGELLCDGIDLQIATVLECLGFKVEMEEINYFERDDDDE